MRLRSSLIVVLVLFFSLSAYTADGRSPKSNAPDSLATLFSKLDLESAGRESNLLLAHDANNVLALLVRMEVAELEAQTDVVLDSAVRLCSMRAAQNISDVASGRILEYAGNTRAFRAMVSRIETAVRQENNCSFNLRLALMAAAADGDTSLDLDRAANSAGVLTHWRMVGPFGRYGNADFDGKWTPESDRLSHSYYGKLQPEEFWFRDGLFTLPDYFSSAGIFYAASDIESASDGDSLLHVFSSGPYFVFVDGKLVLAHDSRYIVGAGQDSVALKVNAGKHQVMIKFTAEAAPFRVAIHPQSNTTSARDFFDAGPLNAYIEGLNAYFRDDLLTLARAIRSDSSRAADYLRALLYSASDGHSPRARAAWQAVAPAALARIKLAAMTADTEASSAGDFRKEVSEMAKALPDSEAAQQVAFAELREEDVLRRLMTLHPSCSTLSKALKFFTAEQDQSQALEKQLANCAPESLLYAQVLSAAGRHSEAAGYLLKLLDSNAFNRTVRRMLVEELLLSGAGREKEAAQQAERLHEIAPNSASFAVLATEPYGALDASSSRAGGFIRQNQFYVPYRRNALKTIQKSTQRHFAGGPSVTLLSDKVLQVQSGGSISIYTHRITRVLNRDGISRFGEVSIPPGADLLELRTIKSTGQMIEPEVAMQKPTISMPALEPGDSIEEEFVVHYPVWDEVPANAPGFTFGSFNAPILYSRFVVIAPEGAPVQIEEGNDAPHSRMEHAQDNLIQSWERNDIAQTGLENDLPPANQLPFVAITPAENYRARLRDDLIAATRIGVQVEGTSQGFKETGGTEYEKARRLYRFVVAKIQSADADWSANNAEDTLLNSEGSRTAALLALARYGGLKAGLVLAQKTGQQCQERANFNCYATPLVRFWFAGGRIVDTDAESSGLSFGVVPSGLNAEDAVLVPLTVEDETRPLHVALVHSVGNEKSVAKGELFLDENGTMAVELRVRLGAARGQQVRNLLRRTNQRERQMFFDQLAIRIFPGATAISGSSLHQDDPEQAIELVVHCKVPQIINRGGPWELDQLVPALGLRELYTTSATRNFPLYIASVLFESATFHLHLAPDFQLRSLPPDFTGNTEFGNYSVQFNSSKQEITIHREFEIPVQIVASQKYEAFANFARQVDDAERGRILLSFHASAHNSSQLPTNATNKIAPIR